MGNKSSKSTETRQIDEKMREQQEKESKTAKILILGAGSCGKSTLLKQLKYLYHFQKQFPEDENKDEKHFVKLNMEDIMYKLCNKSIEYGLAKDKTLINEYLNMYEQKNSSKTLTTDNESETKEINSQNIEKLIIKLWKSKKSGIKQTFKRRNEFILIDNSEYFMNNIERIFKDNYEPTTKDIMNYRTRTTGIVEDNFDVNSFNGKYKDYYLNIFDVGGERSERKKWIKLFDNVNLIIFMMALSGYNQILWEDHSKNRLSEALELFHSLTHLKCFKSTQFVVFMNKYDLFCEKIKTIPFNFNLEIKLQQNSKSINNSIGPSGESVYACKCDEKDKQNPDNIIEWLIKQMKILDSHDNTYFFVTQANYTANIEKVFEEVQGFLFRQPITYKGFI